MANAPAVLNATAMFKIFSHFFLSLSSHQNHAITLERKKKWWTNFSLSRKGCFWGRESRQTEIKFRKFYFYAFLSNYKYSSYFLFSLVPVSVKWKTEFETNNFSDKSSAQDVLISCSSVIFVKLCFLLSIYWKWGMEIDGGLYKWVKKSIEAC